MTHVRLLRLLLWTSSLVLLLPCLTDGMPAAAASGTGVGPGTLTTDEVPRRFVRGGSLNANPGVAAEVCARLLVEEIRASLALTAADEAVLTRAIRTASGHHFLFEQRHEGLPVLGAYVAVHVGPQGGVRLAVNELAAGLPPPAMPLVSRDEAFARSRARVGITSGPYHADPRADLALTREGRLVWNVLLPADEPFGDWQLLLDARSGEILSVDDLVVTAVEGAGDVFDPNPVVTLQNQGLSDQNDAPGAIPPGAYRHVALPGLDDAVGGLYYLRGEHCSIEDFEPPMTVRATAATPNGFDYDRGDDRFEEANVYYHVDGAVRRLNDLGFEWIFDHRIVCDAHGLSGEDNSHYVPSTGRLAFGDGCVDDAEDAEVIWHEFGHAVQDAQVPGWVGTGESGAMGEGFADFLAGVFSEPASAGYGIEQIFDWDRGPVDGCWAGRRLDSTKHYPEDLTGDIYEDGEIWSAVLWEIALAIGRERSLAVVLESHTMVPPGGSFEDGAVAVILADAAIRSGADIPLMLDLFEQRGIINQAEFAPAISHVPPPSTEDPIGPYVVTATVHNYAPIPPDSVRAIVRMNGGGFVSMPMQATGGHDEYGISLLGVPVGTMFEYYFRASDFAGLSTRLPAGEGAYFTFSVSEDVTPPAIEHAPLADAPYGTWPPALSASVTDAHGVDSVRVVVRVDGLDAGVFDLPRVEGTDTYAMEFPLDASQVCPGSAIEYRLLALDASVSGNSTFLPSSAQYYSFTVLDAEGRVLVIDDDAIAGTPVLSADLAAAGFLVTTVTPGALSSNTLIGYDFVGWACAANMYAVAHAGARGIIEEYIAGGGKLFIEGGDVGNRSLTYPRYPSFAANVLHVAAWATNYGGNLRPLPWKEAHPVLYVPNPLPATITIQQGAATQYDVLVPAQGAEVLADFAGTESFGWSGYGGIIVWDDDGVPQSGRVVFCTFSLERIPPADIAIRRNLVSNVGHYLTARQGSAGASIAGRVDLPGDPSDKSGTIVRSLTQDALAFTAADGSYVLHGLHSTPQLLEFSHAGYETVQLVAPAPPEGAALADQNATLRAVDAFSYRAEPYQTIPDNSPAGIGSVIDCPMNGTVHDILVSVVIHHGYVGDLIVELRSPSGRTVRLRNRSGKGADNVITTFDSEQLPDWGTLDTFAGDATFGAWTLTVSDNQQVEVGTFDSWTLLVTSLQPTTVTPDPETPPARAGLELLTPNPFASGARLAYTIPRDGVVRIAVYDLAGREIAKLADGRRAAGRYEVVWNARDREGRRAGAGVYFCRMSAPGVDRTRKLVLLE